METIRSYIYRVKENYEAGVVTSYSSLSSRVIYESLIDNRAALLSQKANKNQPISDWCYQTIKGIELEKVKTHELNIAPSMGEFILKSKYEIPEIVSFKNGLLLQSVSNIIGNQSFSQVKWSNYSYLNKGRKYSKSNPAFFIKDNFLFLTGSQFIELITINAIFKNPLSAQLFLTKNCKIQTCISYHDYDFPMDGEKDEALIDLTVRKLAEIMKQLPQDNIINYKDDTSTTKV